MHVWQLTDNNTNLEYHINFHGDMKISKANEKADIIKKVLKEKYNISHSTIEMEYKLCDNNNYIRDER